MSVTAPVSTANVRRQLGDLRQRLAEQRAETARLRENFADDGSHDTSRQLARSLNVEAALKAEIEDLRAQEQSILGQYGGGFNGTSTLGDRLADAAFMGELAKMAHSTARLGDVPIGEIAREDVMAWIGRNLAAATGTVTPTPGMGQVAVTRVVPYPTPETTFISLIPTQPLDAPSMAYAQEVRAAGGPAPTPPGAIKPAVDLSYVDAEATPETIAGYTKVQRQTLSDVPTLQTVIETRLTDALRTALEAEVISGDGAVSDQPGKPGIVGLLNTSGIAAPPITGGTPLLDAIRKAKTAVRTVGGVPNFVAINEADAEAIELTKSTGSGEYVANPFLTTAAQPLWGLTLTPGMGVPQGKVVVGDSRGFTLLMRENAQIRISDADQDDMIRNRLTLLVELRAALAVWIPSFFAVVEVS